MSESPNEPRPGELLEPSRIDPQTEKTQADAGTKLFVTFFFLVVPPLGLIILAAVCWKLYKTLMAT
jgi:hypothetical protein